ncbi:MAG: TRAP transporter large permease subunit [Deltaproteobacteria bacterium]|nr:MAG: TRAP transporter large permease subunit [Deltaproteobacteria bacterium]
MITLLIIVLLVLALFGLPLFLVIGGIAMLLAGQLGLDPALFFVQSHSQLVDAPAFVSIPLFTFAGYMMAESKTSERLVNLFESMLGWMPGGLTIQILVVCSFFTIFTGASGVTIVALGTLLYPVLLKSKYPEEYSLGLLTASGSLGLLLPPSLPLILYGVIAGRLVQSLGMELKINSLFWAGIIPGFLMIAILSLHGIWVSRNADTPRQAFDIKRLGKAFWEAKWEAALPVIVLWLLFSGSVAIPEVALITAAYLFIIEVFVYKDLKVSDMARVTTLSLKLVGSIFIILMSALALSDILIRQEVPDKLFLFLKPYITNKYMFLFVLNIFLLLVGCLLDIFSAILVVVPLIVPLSIKFGIHPVHLGIIFLANLELGYMTPPVGLNLFISSLTFKKPVLKLYRVSLPFLGLLGIALILITYIPAISLWLPEATGSIKPPKPGIMKTKDDDDQKGPPKLDLNFDGGNDLGADDGDLDDEDGDEGDAPDPKPDKRKGAKKPDARPTDRRPATRNKVIPVKQPVRRRPPG